MMKKIYNNKSKKGCAKWRKQYVSYLRVLEDLELD